MFLISPNSNSQTDLDEFDTGVEHSLEKRIGYLLSTFLVPH